MTQAFIVNVNLNPETLVGCRGIASAIASLAPDLDLQIVPWRRFPDLAMASGTLVILGPNETPFAAYPAAFTHFLQWVRALEGPLLGICGGHQVLGLAYGAEVGPVADIPPPRVSYDGLPATRGLVDLAACLPASPLLLGMGEQFLLDASHVEELKSVPGGFDLVATHPNSAVQLIAHRDKQVVGIQCHPERAWAQTQGRRLLRNFLDWVGSPVAGPSG